MHLFRSLQFVFQCVYQDWNLKQLNNCNVYTFLNSELFKGILSKEGHFEEGHFEEGHLDEGHLEEGKLGEGHLGEGHLEEGHLGEGHLRRRAL